MQTYFYVDIYFILNLIMNFFLCVFTAMIRQKKCCFLRFVFLSLLYALISVLITYVLWQQKTLLLFAAIMQIASFVFLIFPRQTWKEYRKNLLSFFTAICLTAGEILMMLSIVRGFYGNAGSVLWIFGALLLFLIVLIFLRHEWIRMMQNQKSMVEVTIFSQGKTVTVKALYDTGNRLFSPYTGEAVWIISKNLADKIELAANQLPVLIPYQSIGGSGMLKAYRIKKVEISGKHIRENVLVAVSENLKEANEIQMILNIT